MIWFRKWFAGSARQPAAPRPTSSCRPQLEQLEQREVLSTSSPSFALQSNGNLVQTNPGGTPAVVDTNVKTFNVVTNNSGQNELFDLHTDGSLHERTFAGTWSTLNTGVGTLKVFSNSSGQVNLAVLTTSGSLLEYIEYIHTWWNIAPSNVTWMQGTADSTGRLAHLFWLTADGTLSEFTAGSPRVTLRSNVQSVSVFDNTQGSVTLLVTGRDGSLWKYAEATKTWTNIQTGGVTWAQGVADQSGNPSKFYWLNANGQLYQWLPNGQTTLVNQFVTSATVNAQGNLSVQYNVIGQCWNALNRPASLGTPQSAMLRTPDGQGLYAQFSNGLIIWTASTGTHSIQGTMYQDWVKLGGGTGTLGYPTTEAVTAQDGSGNARTQIQQFRTGALVLLNGTTPVLYAGANYAQLNTVLAQLTDANVRATTLSVVVEDGQLNRDGMIAVLREVAHDGTVTAGEFASLQTLLALGSKLNMPAYVQDLAGNVVNGDPADAHFKGQALGNLHVGSSGTQLIDLVDKWFYGADHPNPTDDFGHTNYTYQLAQGSLYGPGNVPQYQDVKQGEVGDCYLLAALAGVALDSPQAISSMIIDNHDALDANDDTYTVRLWNPQANSWDYVTVDRWMPANSSGQFVFANLGQQVSSSTNVLWVALVEKAYVEAAESGWMSRAQVNAYTNISSGWSYQALQNITGKTAVHNTLGNPTAVAQAFQAGNIVILNSVDSPSNGSLVEDHSYLVVSYSASTGLTLFNPWGMQGGSEGGTSKPGLVTLPLSQLAANFDTWDNQMG